MIVKNHATGQLQQIDAGQVLQMDLAVGRCRREVAKLGLHSISIAYGILEDKYRHARRSGDMGMAQEIVGRCMAMSSQAALIDRIIDSGEAHTFESCCSK